MNICVGSKNPIKIAAACDVLYKVYPHSQVIGIEVASNVPSQPWGEIQTRHGAMNRAKGAIDIADADLGVGFEGGVIETEYGLMSCAWCCVVDRSGRFGFGGGVNFLIPQKAEELIKTGSELGEAMDFLIQEENTKQREGAVGILTAGLTNRRVAYAGILSYALTPFLRDDLYRSGGKY